MQLEKMTAKNLTKWILKLYKLLNDDDINKPLYQKWLKEAEDEKANREYRKRKYLEEVKRERDNQN